MAKISEDTYREIRHMILAEQLFPLAGLDLRDFLERGNVGLHYNIVLDELKQLIASKPDFEEHLQIEGENAYLQIELLMEAREIFLRFLNEETYEMGIKILSMKNSISKGFNKEIEELKKLKTSKIKAELDSFIEAYADYHPEDESMEERAISIVKCILESLVFSRSLLGRIESFFFKRFPRINIQLIEREILA